MYSSDHVFESPHVRGRTRKERAQSRRQNCETKKQQQHHKTERDTEAAREAALEQAKVRHTAAIAEVLALIQERGLTWGDIVLHMSDPLSGLATERYDGFFKKPENVQQVLEFWASSRNSRTGRLTVTEWAMQWVAKSLRSEATRATESGLLLSRRMTVDEDFIYNFDMSELHAGLKTLCPRTFYLMEEFSMSARQKKELTGAKQKQNLERVAATLIDLLGIRSQNNSYMKHILGLYLYASGAPRQLLSVLSHLGMCSSYQTLAGTVAERGGLRAATGDDSEDSDGTDSGSDSEWEASSETSLGSSDSEAASPDVDSLQSEESVCALDELELLSSENPTQARAARDSKSTPMVAGGEDAPEASVTPVRWRGMGLLRRLSEACRLRSRQRAQTTILGYVYDNINMMFKVAEQILGRRDTQQNGTCATVFPLYSASPAEMRTADLVQSYDAAPPLSIEDIILSSEEDTMLQFRLLHAVLRIIVLHGGLHFARFRSDLMHSTPETDDKIPLHQTEIRPLPAMHIDESTITGNAEVMSTIFRELGFNMTDESFADTVKLVFGDQLSIARLRTLMLNRSGHDSVANAYPYVAFGPGFFHHQMAMTHGFIKTHWGDPATGASNPGSLSFHNTTLERKPIVLSSLPPYRTCRDLIFVSLDARVLHCLELVTSCASIDNYAQNVTWEELVEHAGEIVKLYADPQRVWRLRSAREVELLERKRDTAPPESEAPVGSATAHQAANGPAAPTCGDMVFENAVLFMRDALVLRELADTIKAGDSGRVILILKVMALSYRGSGRLKYAHEMLFLIHNLTHVWPKPLCNIILKNWLVNPTGKANSWVPVDLLQEHMNFWIKTIYKAQGSNASWRWIEMVAPCVDILRKLAAQINGSLGSKQGMKHHTPELEKDIQTLKNSLDDFDVYRVQPGRVIEHEKAIVPNVLATGFNQLRGPLEEYNKTFQKLKQRRRNQPVLGEPIIPTHAPHQRDRGATQTTTALAELAEASEITPEDDDYYECDDAEDNAFDEDDLDASLLFSLEEEGDVDLEMDAL